MLLLVIMGNSVGRNGIQLDVVARDIGVIDMGGGRNTGITEARRDAALLHLNRRRLRCNKIMEQTDGNLALWE